jgi:hypothetical protein
MPCPGHSYAKVYHLLLCLHTFSRQVFEETSSYIPDTAFQSRFFYLRRPAIWHADLHSCDHGRRRDSGVHVPQRHACHGRGLPRYRQRHVHRVQCRLHAKCHHQHVRCEHLHVQQRHGCHGRGLHDKRHQSLRQLRLRLHARCQPHVRCIDWQHCHVRAHQQGNIPYGCARQP